MSLSNKILFVNSEDKASGESDSNFTIQLQDSQEFRGQHLVSLKKASIPYSYYTLPSTKRGRLLQHVVKIDHNGLVSTLVFAFATTPGGVGSPTATQFATAFQAYMNTAAGVAGSTNTYTVTWENIVGKYRITETSGGNPFTLTFDDSQYSATLGFDLATSQYLAILLGFNQNQSFASTFGDLFSENVADLSGTRTLRVVLEGAGLKGIYDYPTGQGREILGTIQVGENSLGIINYVNNDIENSRRLASNINSRMRIRLLDDLDDEVDLNGLTWRCEILFQR